MPIGKIHSFKKVLSQLLLLVLPTVALAFYVLWDVNRFYSILQNDWLMQGCYFASGLTISTIFYAYRFRFVSTIATLAVLLTVAYNVIERVNIGEFDTFLASIRFMIFAILFSIGWLAGYGFSRARWFTVLWSVLLLIIQVSVVSKTGDIKANALIGAFAPVLAYAIYIIYTAELIRNMNEDETGFGWFLFKRMLGFAVVLGLLLVGIFTYFEKDFKAIEKEWGGMQPDYNKKGNSESMTKQNKDGSISNKDQTRLTGSLNKGKRLVFVAKLDNFLADGKTPNPLYFTSDYYTKFDTVIQAFETDPKMPSNDLFSPDVSKIPMYFTKVDTNVIKNTRAVLNRRIVNADVYKVLLSPNDFLAPSTAFYCQPIGVPKEYKEQYKSAYRAKMWVSDLNSAYFIYNPAGNQQLEQFQEQRFAKLREVSDFTGLDKTFADYYTFMPKDAEYNKITTLAKEITKGVDKPIDKMLAIRNYFLSKDEFGQPLFKYSDNPGIPGLPSANKLSYFLFDNHKGYCAYYAGATLFMLRALGVPSRIAVGFLTVDRSSKNPGWYWFYEDQAHAWTQVFFPGYGWMDFDTTIPDVNTQQASQPDQTPPMDMQQVYMVADGIITNVDTTTKLVKMKVENLLYHDKNYATSKPEDLTIDASLATVSADSATVKLSDLKKGMHITAASYAEVLKNINPTEKDNIVTIIKKIPNPVPVDEIKIIEKDETKVKKKKQQLAASEPIDWIKTLWIALATIGIFIFVVFATPYVIWLYLHSKAKGNNGNIKISAYNRYRAASYYLNQLGYSRALHGPQQYAQETDERFGTSFYKFSNVNQKIKYSTAALSVSEADTVQQFYTPFIKQVRSKVPFKTRVSRFLNIYNTIQYFTQPK